MAGEEAAEVEGAAILSAFAEPIRRRLHQVVRSSPEGVNREEAARALGISRSVAAFHLDKLAELDLVAVQYRRPPGRSGPGAGRPAKYYLPVDTELSFSVPDRRYDAAARILSDAVVRADELDAPVRGVLPAVAREHGREVGVARVGEHEGLVDALRSMGYEPRDEHGDVTLGNCPFHSLAERHRALVCHMNAELLAGLLEGMGSDDTAVLDPSPGRCCVRIHHSR